MITKDYLYGVGTALLLFAIGEGIALLIAYKTNRALKISKIEDDANATVEALSDAQLKSKLDSELDGKS